MCEIKKAERSDLAVFKKGETMKDSFKKKVAAIIAALILLCIASSAVYLRKTYVKINGKTFRIVGMGEGAFSDAKAGTIVVKTKALTKESVRGSLKGSKVKRVKVKVGSKKINKKYVKKYRKIFTKKNAGRKVKVS